MRKILSTILAITLFVLFAVGSVGCAAAGYTVFEPQAAFSGDITLSAKIYGGRANDAFDGMLAIVREIDEQVSTTNENSDLSSFNAASLNEVEVGEHCYKLFTLSREYYELTDGAFNVASFPLVELWHLDPDSITTLRPDVDGSYVSPELPAIDTVEESLTYCSPLLIESYEKNGKFYLKKQDPRVRLDFGGIAKGYAADLCAQVLNEYGVSSALIDISGNAYFYGDYIERGKSAKWNVGIMSPRPRAGELIGFRGYVCAVSVGKNTSAVTSGDYMRYYVHDGANGKVYVPHVIGADGLPVGVAYDGEYLNSDEWVISATVIGEKSSLCDALSTAVMVCGIEEGARLLQKTGYKGLIFTQKRYTIIGNAELYKPDVYDGFTAYEQYEL